MTTTNNFVNTTNNFVNTIFLNSYIGKSKFMRKTEPLIGHKKAYIKIRAGKAFIGSVQGPQGHRDVELNAVSKCPTEPEKHAGRPSRFCTCGFYAYKGIGEAIGHMSQYTDMSVIRTVASGKILMYEKGFRSARQRVEEVIYRGCMVSGCESPADRLARRTDRYSADLVVGVCADHGNRYRCKTFAWLETVLAESLTSGEPPIKVRQMDSRVVPWDGIVPPTPMPEPKEIQHEPSKEIGFYRYAMIPVAGFAGVILMDIVHKVFL